MAAIPLLPWVQYLLSGADHGAPWSWAEFTSLAFPRLLFSDALGLGLDYSLGTRYLDFLRYPTEWSAFYPVLYLQGVSFTCGAVVFAYGLKALFDQLRGPSTGRFAGLWTSNTALATFAAVGVFGVLLTCSGATVYRHYLHVTFPFEAVLLASLAIRFAPAPRRWLLAIWLAQLGVSSAFLQYIHANGGAVGGDYGRAYRGE